MKTMQAMVESNQQAMKEIAQSIANPKPRSIELGGIKRDAEGNLRGASATIN